MNGRPPTALELLRQHRDWVTQDLRQAQRALDDLMRQAQRRNDDISAATALLTSIDEAIVKLDGAEVAP